MRRLSGNDPEVNEEWISDKDRFAFHYARQDDRITYPQVRDRIEDGGELRARLLDRGLRRRRARPGRRRLGRCADRRPGDGRGRLRLQQVRPRGAGHQRHRLPGTSAQRGGGLLPGLPRGAEPPPAPGGVTYADLERASVVVLAGFEPEDEAGTLFLRLRKAVTQHGTRVVSMAPFASRGLEKLQARLVATAPGDEPAALAELANAARSPSTVAASSWWGSGSPRPTVRSPRP